LAFPTLAAAYRITPSIDIGVGVSMLVGQIDELAVAYYDPGGGACKNREYAPCDAQSTLKAQGGTLVGSAGVLARPSPSFELGAQVRSPASLNLEGTVSSKLGPTAVPDAPASATIDFPWIVRAGARHIFIEDPAAPSGKPFERADVELDGTYEVWGGQGSLGQVAVTPDPVTKAPTSLVLLHKWKNTYSVRLGGGYNVAVGESVLTLRAGTFYDSPTSDSAYTRLDVNTLPKVAGTAGVGFKSGAFSVNVAYAFVGSIPRTVTDGDLRPSNAAKGGRFVDGDDKPLPAVNNGYYSAFSHLLSLGLEVSFGALFGDGERKSTYGDPAYEEVARSAKVR
jgi:long-subunit fatty acid transport protein